MGPFARLLYILLYTDTSASKEYLAKYIANHYLTVVRLAITYLHHRVQSRQFTTQHFTQVQDV